MNWHSFFSLQTMESRHLLASYIVVLTIQGGYFARIVWSWTHPKSPRN